MSIIDIILLICFIPALVSGLKKGLISQLIAIISIVAGVWISFEFATVTSQWLGQYLEAPENILRIAAFALIMVGVFVVLGLVGKLLEGILNLVMLGWANKLFGVLFSFLKTALITGLLIMVFNSLNTSLDLVSQETLSESVLYTPLKNFADSVFPYIREMISNL